MFYSDNQWESWVMMLHTQTHTRTQPFIVKDVISLSYLVQINPLTVITSVNPVMYGLWIWSWEGNRTKSINSLKTNQLTGVRFFIVIVFYLIIILPIKSLWQQLINLKFTTDNIKVHIHLALYITSLVRKTCTGWKLLSFLCKCIDCPTVCNQKLFPVSSSENEYY